MKTLVALISLCTLCTLSNGRPETAIQVPSSYNNGVKWVLGTDSQSGSSVLESAGTQNQETDVLYSLPASESEQEGYDYAPQSSGQSVAAEPQISSQYIPSEVTSNEQALPEIGLYESPSEELESNNILSQDVQSDDTQYDQESDDSSNGYNYPKPSNQYLI